MINFYQRNISSNTGPRCKYTPTCSEYSKQCYTHYNFFKATGLTCWRILRCNPFSKGGYDPIPLEKKLLQEELEKEMLKEYMEKNEEES